MFDIKGGLAIFLIIASLILLVLNLINGGSIYSILSNILIIAGMVFVLIAKRKSTDKR
ncbi:hypothetical protein RB2501_12232 [Robiginitalea biformata HTCC2501]|uniref:Uncharacterized protein n=1 Tax=Robiginitalea biformata (strain ATCC BAA-864 / DSM 15991 / KCTC 12146 / HTCC2501) TaxID=313596 RepID=A4CN53_ROBBH|nr:hypothetical protein RB2501_12232 [Robiginitalea biformata HTCC2501]